MTGAVFVSRHPLAANRAAYSGTVPAGRPYSGHVGCGGTAENWRTDNRSDYLTATQNVFDCDDTTAAALTFYGHCEHY